MSRSDNVTIYFMRITQVRDQLAAIEEKMEDIELVNVVLNGLSKSWEPFVKGVCTQEKSQIGKRFEMIASMKGFRRSLRIESKEVVMRTCLFSVR